MGLRAAAVVTLGLLAGCASDRATPTPATSLPSLGPLVVTVPATATVTTAVAPQPATSSAVLTDVYGQPLDTGLTFTVPLPATTATPPPPPSSPKTAPRPEKTAPPTTDCPPKKHRRHCKP